MKRVARTSKFWVAMILWSSFWIIAYFVPVEYLFYLTNSLVMCLAGGILVAYYPGIKDALVRRDVSGGHWLILGIAVTWLTTMGRIGWGWMWRVLGYPEWMFNNSFLAFLTWMLATGGMLHLIAQDAIDGQIPRRNWVRLGALASAGLFLAFVIGLLYDPTLPFSVVP